jgi:LysR family transcriptional regulator, regulator for bpeEF and oprC
MNLEQLRVLSKVVEAGSFAGAADVMGMQRSNVSRTIAQLEAELGIALIERTTRRQSVSEAGRAVYERALAALEAADDVARIAQHAQEEPRGLLRLTCGVEFGIAAVGAWIEAYLALHPQVAVEAEYASREIDLVHEGFDLAIRAGPLRDSRLAARALGRLRYGLFASPGYLRRRGAPRHPQDLTTHALVAFTGDGLRPRWRLVREGEQVDVAVAASARLRVNAGSAVASALLQGLGIGLLPLVIAAEPVRRARLQAVLPEWAPAPVEVFAVYPSRRYLTPKLRAFVDLAQQQFPDRG